MKHKDFECDGKKYYWMTIDELEQDIKVQKKNRDIVGYVKALVQKGYLLEVCYIRYDNML